jgi:hypothetical protein
VQRRLVKLIAERHIAAVGKGKSTAYKLLAPIDIYAASPSVATSSTEESYFAYIPLSEGGREVFSYVRRPTAGRTPVGFQREFLDAYIPNESRRGTLRVASPKIKNAGKAK